MITPPYLQAGDKIAIVATARKVLPSEMETDINTFRTWGLQVSGCNHLSILWTIKSSEYWSMHELRT